MYAKGQVRHGDAFLDPVVHAVDRLVVVAGKVQHRLAHGLGGDGAGVDAGAPDDLARLHERDALAVLGAVDRGALACGSGADDDEVVHSAHKGALTPLGWRRAVRSAGRERSRRTPLAARPSVS